MGFGKGDKLKRHHVYCTCCIRYSELSQALEKIKNYKGFCHNGLPELPKQCRSCYPWDSEDSRNTELRKNYKESLSGWWWLTKWDISEFFRYRKWRFWFK